MITNKPFNLAHATCVTLSIFVIIIIGLNNIKIRRSFSNLILFEIQCMSQVDPERQAMSNEQKKRKRSIRCRRYGARRTWSISNGHRIYFNGNRKSFVAQRYQCGCAKLHSHSVSHCIRVSMF